MFASVGLKQVLGKLLGNMLGMFMELKVTRSILITPI
jgi:hypothetical protein